MTFLKLFTVVRLDTVFKTSPNVEGAIKNILSQNTPP
jgi:hypothetical protein